MQHSVFLWWVSIVVVTITGGVVGVFCSLTARHYDSLIRRGYCPDGASLAHAMQEALAAPAVPIIWAETTKRSDVCTSAAMVLGSMVLLGVYIAYGNSVESALVGTACIVLLLLACIDVRVCLLPDALTQPLLWLGLVRAWADLGMTLQASVSGVLAGYFLLAVPRVLWYWWRKQDGVGAGDIKLLAALGAWLGVIGVMHALLIACMTGVAFAVFYQRSWRPSGTYPFGPFLVLGSFAEFLSHSDVKSWF